MQCQLSLVLSWPGFQFAVWLPVVTSYLETGSRLVHKCAHTADKMTKLFSLQYIEDYWELSATVTNSVHTTDKTRESAVWTKQVLFACFVFGCWELGCQCSLLRGKTSPEWPVMCWVRGWLYSVTQLFTVTWLLCTCDHISCWSQEILWSSGTYPMLLTAVAGLRLSIIKLGSVLHFHGRATFKQSMCT